MSADSTVATNYPPARAKRRQRTLATREEEQALNRAAWQRLRADAQEYRQARVQTAAELADTLQREAEQALVASAGVRDAADYGQLILAATRLIDKAELLRGHPTSIDVSADVDPGRVADLLAMAEERRRAAIPTAQNDDGVYVAVADGANPDADLSGPADE